EAILQQMSDDDGAKVRRALVELDDIPPDEQRQVLAEFLREQGAPAWAAMTDDDVALEIDPAIEAAAAPMTAPTAPAAPAGDELPFEFLRHVDAKAIAVVLHHEQPQTVAVVVAHLPPGHAAAVLEELPAPLATEALERTAWLDEIALEV